MEAGDLLFRQDFSGGTSKMKTNSHRFSVRALRTDCFYFRALPCFCLCRTGSRHRGPDHADHCRCPGDAAGRQRRDRPDQQRRLR